MRKGRAVTIVVTIVFAATLAGCDWTMGGQSPNHAGWNAFESTFDTTNIGGLTEVWDATMPRPLGGPDNSLQGATPAVANGVVYLAYNRSEGAGDQGRLYAYDAAGHTNCTTGTPRSCDPLWAAVIQTNTRSSPAVGDNTVFVTAPDIAPTTGGFGALYAFDARGTTNCSDTPKMCTPLWTARVPGPTGFVPGSPVIAYGHVYVDMSGRVEVFDEAGVQGCSGTPKVCAPLFTIPGPDDPTPGGDPTIANGKVYLGGGSDNPTWIAYDALGEEGCSGTPRTCGPLFGGLADCAPVACFASRPVVQGNKVLMGMSGEDSVGRTSEGELTAFDANGVENCSPGTILDVECSPVWSTGTRSVSYGDISAAAATAYVNESTITFPSGSSRSVGAFDINGVNGCTTTAGQTTCDEIRNYAVNGPITITQKFLVADELSQVTLVPISGTGGTSVPVADAVEHDWQLPVVDGRIYVPAKGVLRVYGLP
jgi:hypothetical protein